MCLADYVVRLQCSPRRWPRRALNPVQIRGNSACIPSLALGIMAFFDKTNPLVMMLLCSTFTAAYKTDMLAAGNTKADKMELSDEKELPEPHATGAHGQMELPDETELPDEKGLHGKPSPQSVGGSEIF